MDLPELRSKVAAYLDPPQLATAASVCRNWYETFNPILYHKLKWISSTNDIPQPTIAALQANAHHIRDLGIHLGAQIAPLLVCTRLEKLFIALYIHSLETWQQLTQLVRQNPNLRQLSTFMGGQNVTREFTKALSECSGLKHLVPRLGNIDHEAAEFLFDACVQLEYLDLEKSRFTNVESLDRWSKFPAMEHLVMGSPRGMPSRIQYDFIRKCGQLKHLSWSFQNTHTISVTEVCSLFSKYCPRLESVEFEFAPFADEDMACILDTCPKMISLKASPSFFGAQSFRALARHFMFLETLNISSCPWVSSAMSLQLLMSCPQLTMFCANILDARDILGITVDEQDRPTAPLHPQDWVCTNLKTLSVFICGLEGKHAEWQPLVLRQLARMDKLERLHIGLNHPQLTSDGIDLRLACGLDILSSLKHLRAITFHGLLQRMDEDDIRWMLAAWPDLQLLQGQVHDDETRKQELEEILRASLEAFVPEG